MTDSRTLEGQISRWLEDDVAGARFPEPLLRATFEQAGELRQARVTHWRFPKVRSSIFLSAAGVVAVAVALTGALALGGIINLPPPATPGPTPQPSMPHSTEERGSMWPQ